MNAPPVEFEVVWNGTIDRQYRPPALPPEPESPRDRQAFMKQLPGPPAPVRSAAPLPPPIRTTAATRYQGRRGSGWMVSAVARGLVHGPRTVKELISG
jgi:hypothetical protein